MSDKRVAPDCPPHRPEVSGDTNVLTSPDPAGTFQDAPADDDPRLHEPITQETLVDFIQQLKSGQRDAMEAVWKNFFSKLLAVANNHLRMIGANYSVDHEDVVASVFESIWTASSSGQLNTIRNVDELFWLLLVMTRRKCIDHLRKARAKSRWQGKPNLSLNDSSFVFHDAISTEPDPEYVAAMNDELQRILLMMRDEISKKITILKIEGFKTEEIADLLEVAPVTVRRKVKTIQQLFLDELINRE